MPDPPIAPAPNMSPRWNGRGPDDLLGRLRRDSWFDSLLGKLPKLSQRVALPTAAVEQQYRLVVIPGTPDVAWVCLRDSAGTWRWGRVASGALVVSPAQIVANTDNYSPTGLVDGAQLRVTTDASRNLTGLLLTGGNFAGARITLHNAGAFNLVLKDSVTSTATNQFALTGDLTLAPDSATLLEYDGTSARWRSIGGVS